MYICISAMGMPSIEDPGYGIFEFDQAKALAAIGNKIVYVALDTRSFKHKRKYGLSIFRKDNVLIYLLSVPLGGIPRKYNNTFFSTIYTKVQIFLFNYLMHKVIKKEGTPDIVHSHFLDVSAYTSCFCSPNNLPLVITEHWSVLNNDIIPKYVIDKAKKTYKLSAARLCVSAAFAKQLYNVTSTEFRVIPNIVSTEAFFYTQRNHDPNTFCFVTCGALVHGKGHDILIRAFKIVHDAYPASTLSIIGGGGEFEKLMDLTKSLSLQSSVTFCGFLVRDEIRKVFNNSDAFVLASRGETFGVVYIEAMATGLPVIATICGGPVDFVTRENGMLVPPNDITSLSKAMINMIEKISEYNEEEIAKTSKKLFSPDTISTQLMDVYSKVLIK